MNSISRTAYIVQIHQNPEQINKFISQLIREEQADVFVHIDKKGLDGLAGKIMKNPHVFVLKNSINCEWGDISQVDVTLLLIKAVLDSNKEYDYICLRSGQDMLIKNQFNDFLYNNKGKIFMSYRVIDTKELGLMKIHWPKLTRKRYTSAHPIRIYRRALIYFYRKGINIFPNKKSWPAEFKLYKGSQWITIPYEVAQYISSYLNVNPWYYKFFENTLVPDESFFHTLIMNSPYKSQVVNDNLYYLKWGETLSERNSPQTLTSNDISNIEKSNGYFARKFDEKIDKKVIDYFFNNVSLSGSNKGIQKI